ncbi:hypothetical protein GXP70_26415 [Paenibacillus lycopersici]|uniref:Uncharacterized protein n=1 Tax=Paenibacillus lycopersici TaxID=2704462 RepID=A0A6C0G2T5_9BACL|nr:hypothetical protein [Paenibacillus lycopersici]QHT63147.1 hypothetical protein GXP70_26415 [Paenibacillus lycopersici]
MGENNETEGKETGDANWLEPAYVRIQTRYCSRIGKPAGIFAACWHLLRGTMRDDCLSEEDKALFLAIEAWFVEHLPEPPFYEDGNAMRAVTWFKRQAARDMLPRLNPLLGLLVKYGVDYDIVHTDSPGRIVYEDEYQVGVV